MSISFDERINLAIQMYVSGKSLTQAAKEANVGYCSLQPRIKKLKLTRSNKINSRKYEINHNFFDKIDTEEKAYWLGFIYADGYLTNSGSQKLVGIALAIKDKQHLEKFLKSTDSNYPIHDYISSSKKYKKTKYSRIVATSEQMYESLLSHGVFQNKSLVLKFPNLNKSLLRHFVRGYFDGDGSFAKAKRGHSIKICGTKEVLLGILNFFGKKPKLYKRKKDDKNNWYISIGGRLQVKRIATLLYADSTIYLDRKQIIADQYLKSLTV